MTVSERKRKREGKRREKRGGGELNI